MSIWKTLQHPNVLELLGASSASSDPPWFFVSPYYRNGSLVTYLKGLPSLDGVDLLKMIHQIAKGMAYLHGRGILHGDLKVRSLFFTWMIRILTNIGLRNRPRTCSSTTRDTASSPTSARAR